MALAISGWSCILLVLILSRVFLTANCCGDIEVFSSSDLSSSSNPEIFYDFSSLLDELFSAKLPSFSSVMEEELQPQSQELVGIATGFARTDDRVFVQNTVTATVHQAKAHDGGHTMCGWRYAGRTKTWKRPAVPHRAFTRQLAGLYDLR